MRKLSPLCLFLALASARPRHSTARKNPSTAASGTIRATLGKLQNGFFLFHEPGGVVRIFKKKRTG